MSNVKSAVRKLLNDQILSPWFNLTDLVGIICETNVANGGASGKVAATEEAIRSTIASMIAAGEVLSRVNSVGNSMTATTEDADRSLLLGLMSTTC